MTDRYQEGSAFTGVIGRTVADSVAAWPAPERAPAGAPNVVVVLLDDTGFADFGCYGSRIRTPTFDRLASNGLRYRDFHTTALCAPSRACLMTGRNHHPNGFGYLPTTDLGFPGYNARIPRASGFLSEILRENGYATFALGKWHLVPYHEMAAGASKSGWPLERGFDRYYGFHSNGSQFAPDLVYDNHYVAPPRTPEEGYHLNIDMADRALEFIADLRAVEPNKPFFMYYCPSATHNPHHVPREWADRYAGRFDQGWDAVREQVFARQLELGVVPQGTTLSPRPDWMAAWSDLDDEQRKVLARQMEVYAGFLEHTDHHIGRVVSFLDRIGELDNTLFIVTSDNGADGLNGPHGSAIRGRDGGTAVELGEWGGPNSHPAYSWGWAWLGNTPFRRWKRLVHEGGVTDPLVVHWPARILAAGEVRDQYAHITDIVPTVLEALNIEPPQQIRGAAQRPIEGVSFAHTFDNPAAATRKRVQYYEMAASRAIWADGWKAVTEQPAGVLLTEAELAKQRWELYHVAEDPSECHDLAEQHPVKLREMIELWWTEAGKHNVLPLRALRPKGLVESQRPPHGQQPRQRFVYYPGAAPVNTNVAANVAKRSHRITAQIEIPDHGGEGVLLAHGGPFNGGYSLYVKDRRLCYVHVHPEAGEQRIRSQANLHPGAHTVEVEIIMRDEHTGTVTLRTDEKPVEEETVARIIDRTYGRRDAGLCCGYDTGHPVTNDYEVPFRFTGTIRHVSVEFVDPAAEVHQR